MSAPNLYSAPACPECGDALDFIVESVEHNQGRWQCWSCDEEWNHDGTHRTTA